MSEETTPVIDILDDCLENGVFSIDKVSDGIKTLVTIGTLVKTSEEPVTDLTELVNKFETLSVDETFKDNTNKFLEYLEDDVDYKDLFDSSRQLLKETFVTIAAPGEAGREAFKTYFESTLPIERAMKLRFILQQNISNPLKKTMKEDPLATTDSFDIWNSVLNSIFAQLLFVEAYAAGLLFDGDTDAVDTLKEEIANFIENVNEWKAEYQKFWPTNVLQFIKNVQEKETEKSCEEKAVMIKDALEALQTEEVFYILVFPEELNHIAHFTFPEQSVSSLDYGGCDIIVYKSSEARNAGEDDWGNLTTALESYKEVNAVDEWITEEQVAEWATSIENNGVLVAVCATEGVTVAFTKADVLEQGPGRSNTGTLKTKVTDMETGETSENPEEFLLFVAYK